MDWDPRVTEALERMSIYRRERLHRRLLELAMAGGRERITSEDLEAARRSAGEHAEAVSRSLPAYEWPVLAGAFRLLEARAPIAVCTLASEKLVEELGSPPGVAIVGRTFTENLGVQKLAINVVANPYLRVLVLCGRESRQRVGATLRALHEHGLDGEGRVIGSPAPLPILKALPPEALQLFRAKLTLIDLVDEVDPGRIQAAIEEALRDARGPWESTWRPPPAARPEAGRTPFEEDEAGFLLINIGPFRDRLAVEHYDREGRLQLVVEAADAESLGAELLRLGAVRVLSHAAYAGRELARAEAALRFGLAYEQDRGLS